MPKRLNYLILFPFYFLSLGISNAQIPQNIISQYSVSEGLAQSTVTCILNDKTGYLWVATCGGLSRFDGHKFTTFKNYSNQQNSISNNFVRWLYEGKDGSIWIGTEAGLDNMNTETGEITRQTPKDKDFGETWYIPFHDDTDWLYFADAIKGISRIGKKTGSVQNIIPAKMFSSLTNVSCSDGKFSWFCSLGQKTLIQYSMEQNSVEYHKLPGNVDNVLEICIYSDKELLVATNAGLFIFNFANRKFEKVKLGDYSPNMPVRGICRDKHNNWWIALNDDDLLVCSHNLKIVKSYRNKESSPIIKFPTSVTRLYSDFSNNIWIGTDGNGLYSVNPDLNKFEVFRFTDTRFHDANFVRCIASEDNDNLLVGTMNGLYEVRIKDNDFRKIEFSKNGVKADPIITGLTQTVTDKIIVTTNDGIGVFERKKICSIKSLQFKNERISGFSTICRLANDRYIASGSGFLFLMRFSENDNSFSIIDLIEYNVSVLSNTGNDTVFAGIAKGGSWIISVENDKIRLQKNNIQNEYYNNARFNNFFRDRSGFLWAATNMGLMKLNNNAEFIKLYSENEGLPDNNVYGIIEDKEKNLWFSTVKGIGMLNPATESFSKFSTKDGLQSEEFNSGAFYKDKTGIAYFGGINGLTYFNPDSLKFNQNKPKLVVSDFYMPVDKKSIYIRPKHETIRLNFHQNFFSIEVAALEFSNPRLNKYSFLLKGQDVSWSEPGPNNFVSYNNLQPGRYEFWVIASNNDNIWSEKSNLLTIIISPPFWKSLWFRAVFILALVLIFYFLIQLIFTRRMQRKMEALNRSREIDAIRIKLARDLHDSAGTSLTRISLMAEIARMDLNKKIDVTERLESISESSRSLIDSFAEIIWTTNPGHDNLNSLITYIRTFISEFTDGLPIEVRFNIPESVPDIKIKPDTRHNTFLIVKESINNAIRHSKATVLIFETIFSADHFKIIIKDNGIGIGHSGQRAFGNGLISMRERAAAIGATLDFISNDDGTIIELNCSF